MQIAEFYRNEIWGYIAYLGEDEDMALLIGDAVSRLPDEALVLAVEKCVFVSVGRSIQGLTLPASALHDPHHDDDGDGWVILLDDALLNSKPANDVQSVVAHELAHCFLGHNRMTDKGDRSIELAACRLAREWGFEGSGTDEVRHFRKAGE